jgi:signal transduction histidine kinase
VPEGSDDQRACGHAHLPGPGIPREDQERLTKPFGRGQTTLNAEHSRGLGLPMAQAIATSHEGALWFSSHEPRGFTACLVLA